MASLFIHFHNIAEESAQIGVINPREDQYESLKPYLKGQKNGIVIIGNTAFLVAKVAEKRLFFAIYAVIDRGYSHKSFAFIESHIITRVQGLSILNQFKEHFCDLKEQDNKSVNTFWPAQVLSSEVHYRIREIHLSARVSTELGQELSDELKTITAYMEEKGAEYYEC